MWIRWASSVEDWTEVVWAGELTTQTALDAGDTEILEKDGCQGERVPSGGEGPGRAAAQRGRCGHAHPRQFRWSKLEPRVAVAKVSEFDKKREPAW